MSEEPYPKKPIINGIFVPANGAPGDILPFMADFDTPSNFIADDLMEQSIRNAAKACRQQLSPTASFFQTALPALAHPLNNFWLPVAVLSAVGCLLFSVGDVLWVLTGITPPAFLLPNWSLFIGFSLLFSITLVFSLPVWQILSNLRVLLAQRHNTRQLEDFLDRINLSPQVGHREQQYGHFFGPSAGLTFFCAFVAAVDHSGQQGIFPPWQKRLLRRMNRWVASAALGPDQQLDTVGHLPEKLDAIWRYNHQDPPNGLSLVVFSRRDLSEVESAWAAITQENLQPRPGPGRRNLLADSRQANLTFLFCRSLQGFIYYLCPWAWQWLMFRISAVATILFLAIFLQTPDPPEFRLECEPHLSLSQPGVYALAIEPGQPVSCDLQLISQGYPRAFFFPELELSVEANVDKAIAADLGGTFDKRASLTMRQDSELFFLILPPNLSPQEIVVVITVVNRANKYSQAAIFLTPRQTSP